VLSFPDLSLSFTKRHDRIKATKQPFQPMEPIRVQTKSVYGNDLMYVVSDHAAPIRALTGKKTIDNNDIEQLKKLGFSFVAAPVLLGV
jgi:predicted transcriptional regulator